MALAHGAPETASAPDDHAIRLLTDVGAKPRKFLDGGLDPVRLLDPELLGIPDDGLATGEARSQGQGGDLVQQPGDQVTGDLSTRKVTGLGGDVSNLFASMTPARVGLTPMLVTVTRADGWQTPAISQ